MLFVCSKVMNKFILDDVVYVLDTSTLEITKYLLSEIYNSVLEGELSIRNVRIEHGTMVFLPLYMWFIPCVTFGDNIEVYRDLHYVQHIDFCGKVYALNFYETNGGSFQLVVNDAKITFRSRTYKEMMSGLAYIYRLGSVVVAVYLLKGDDWIIPINLLFTKSGDLVGIIPDGEIDYTVDGLCEDSCVVSKFIVSGRTRGVY